MKDFRNLLTIKPQNKTTLNNKLKVWMKWDSNDADYIERTTIMHPSILFENKKLIYCLAYISCNYNFKGHDWNDNVFCHHITENIDIDNLENILSDNDFVVYSDWGTCHTCESMKITYYDETGTPFNISFNDIIKKWKTMSYKEICNEINNIED